MILICTITVVVFVPAVPCHLYMEEGDTLVEELTDKEEDFIDRAIRPRLNSRLGCQCILLEGAGGQITVLLPDQTQFLGE